MSALLPDGRPLAPMIDHTLLKPDARRAQVEKLCDEARQYGFASVCVLPVWLGVVTERLEGSPVKPCTVVGFPLGGNVPEVKAREADYALKEGAREIDMVAAIWAIKDGKFRALAGDISAVVRTCTNRAIVKVILETCLLTDEEKVTACKIAVDSGAHFVKTSTGLSTGGATVKDVRLLRLIAGESVGVKASGGIRTFDQARAMIEAGANRIGTSAGVEIVGSEIPPAST
jgi:deoxyribose-phosphate aldolase